MKTERKEGEGGNNVKKKLGMENMRKEEGDRGKRSG